VVVGCVAIRLRLFGENVSLYASLNDVLFVLVRIMYGDNVLGLIGGIQIWQPAELQGTI